MSDPLDQLRDLVPPVDPTPDVLDRVRNDLMAQITAERPAPSPLTTPRARRRHVRRWVGGIAAFVVLVSAGTAWAIARHSSEGSTSIMCPGLSVIDSVSGDPVADCTDWMRQVNGTEPPPLVAYDNGRGGIEVRLASEDQPEGYTPLPGGTSQNTQLIELEAVMSDAGGLAADCNNEAVGRAFAEGELRRLGLDTWTVVTDDARLPNGADRCAFVVVRSDLTQLQLIGIPPQPNPLSAFATELAGELKTSCVNLADAAQIADSLASRTQVIVNGTPVDLSEGPGRLGIHQVEDPAADCTRSTVNVGGSAEVTLRGPR